MSEQQIDPRAQALETQIAKLQEGIDAMKAIIKGLQEERKSSPEAAQIIDLQIANYSKAVEENEQVIEQLGKDSIK